MAFDPGKTPTITALIAEKARKSPDSAALHYDRAAGAQDMSWTILDDLGRRIARGLADLGIGPGDRLALWLPNVPAWLALYLGCTRLGAIAVSINTRFRSAEVGDIIARSGATALALWPGFRAIDFLEILAAADAEAFATLKAVIVYDEEEDGDGGATATALPGALERCRVVRYGELAGRPRHDRDLATPHSACNIFATSGTTSAPKFVLHRHAGVVRHAVDVARSFGFDRPDAASLQALPLCGIFGFCQAMASLAGGRCMTLMPAFDAARAAELVRARRITHLCATDGMYGDMLDAMQEAKPFPSLRMAGFAAFGARAGDIAAKAEQRGLNLVGLYGMSEIQALFARQKANDDLAVRGRAGGWPVSEDAAVRVRDPDTGRLLGHGEAGELEARGPSLMAGYFGDDAATAESVTEDGFVRTGDLAHTLADGSFVFHARMGDALRLGGFLVNPAEIEAFVANHPGIAGCQVVGVEHDGRTRPFAFVTLDRGAKLDHAALIASCTRAMAGFKVPLAVSAIEVFPVTVGPNGTKIQRTRLREMAVALTMRA